ERLEGRDVGEAEGESARILGGLGVVAVADPPGFGSGFTPPPLPEDPTTAPEHAREARTISLEPLAGDASIEL
ncbi:MAG TPA: hypothetical protein VJ922_04230, partial [Actinomycetota bacterium]|nr:hypothetical protein [Actinomycetota bacterium]